MFSFLNSTVLFAAAAALIPLIIHLFSRRRRKVIEFSSLRHLKAMQRRQVRRLQIRQLLLLILRMLIILIAVLAFARPTTESGDVGAHASVSAVVLMDNSASMDRFVRDGTLFEVTRKRVRELLATFGQSDEVCLIPLSRTAETEPVGFASAAVAAEQLESLSVGYRSADFQTAVEQATDLLSNAGNLNQEIFIVSDRQRQSLPEAQLLTDVETNVYFVDLPQEDTENRGIISVDFGGQLIQPGREFDVVATVRNYGEQDSQDLIASLFLNGTRVAQTDFSVEGSGETTVRFTRSVALTGFHSGYVEISDDKFLADNRYYFSFRIPERFTLLVIRGDDGAEFVKLALAPAPETSSYWSVKDAAPTELSGVDFRDYDVVMLAGAPALNSSHVTRLKQFVRRGKALFVSYGGETDMYDFNDVWSDVTGVTIEEPARREFTRAGYYSFQAADLNHPIFSVFDFENDQPPRVKFYTLPTVSTSDSADVLMQFTGDRPALVESQFGSGKVITFTGPLGPYYSYLVSHGFFVPFVSRTAEYLAADLSSYDIHLYSDDNVTRSLSLAGSVTDPVDLITPDSSLYFIPPEEQAGALVIKAQPSDMPGVYRVRYRGREIDRFAVNVNPDECDLAAADPDQFASALGVSEPRRLEDGMVLASEISAFRIGRELWHIFLWVAVALLIAEMVLSRGAPAEE
jgi:hypothetical protein